MRIFQHVESPVEKRFQKRETFHRNQVRASFKVFDEDGRETPVNLNIENLTSFGILAYSGTTIYQNMLSPGTVVNDVDIFYNKKKVGKYDAAMVVHSQVRGHQLVIGLKFDNSVLGASKIPPERSHQRVRLSHAYAPSAVCASPISYEDTYNFKIIDISNGGARMETSPRNRLILEDSLLEPLIITLPTVGSYETIARVRYVYADRSNNRVIVGVKFADKPDDFNRAIVKFLVAFADDHEADIIRSIRDAGFRAKYVKSHVEFGYISTLKDYRRVLELRHQSYSRHKKISQQEKVGQMSDYFDLNSRIIVAKSRGELAGSIRVTFCRSLDDRFELESSVKLPDFIDRETTFELSRLCVDPAFEGTDIVLGLIERCLMVSIQEGIRHIVTSCTDDKIKYYKRLGFRPQKTTFELTTLRGIPHHLLIMDMRSPATSFKLNPIFWYYAYSRVIDHIKRFGFLENASVGSIKKAFLKIAIPVVERLKKKKKKR